jgi:GNAT superfamily N-acetyltransferase
VTEVAAPRPLAASDDRNGFDCGREPLNHWFARHAWPNHRDGSSRVSVMTEASSGRIIGFVTLSSSQIERAFLAKAQQRNRPNPLPVTLLGQLAVDLDFQGQGYSASLLIFAMKTAMVASRTVGSIGVITHPIDDSVRGFYARWGFSDLPFDPYRAMMAKMQDLIGDFRLEGWKAD